MVAKRVMPHPHCYRHMGPTWAPTISIRMHACHKTCGAASPYFERLATGRIHGYIAHAR
jgi:hypothetical protein